MPKVGDTVEVNNSIRTISAIHRNVDGNPTIGWKSDRGDEGTCMISVWITWKTTGKDHH